MRLIDADELLEKLSKTTHYFTVKFDVEEQPTVDAVPVVRCRDCKFAYRIDSPVEQYDCRKVSYFSGWLLPYHFCGYGERKI